MMLQQLHVACCIVGWSLVGAPATRARERACPTRAGRQLFHVNGIRTAEHYDFMSSDATCEGPSTMIERFLWFDWLWTRFTGAQQDRLIRNLQHMLASSAFSGFGGFELVLFLLVLMCNRRLSTPLEFIRTFNAGDS